MQSWGNIFYELGLRSIESAYRESRKSFDAELADWDGRWKEHLAAVAAGTEVTVHEDESGVFSDYGDYVGDMIYVAEGGLGLVREAFALVCYHYWEKQARALLTIKDYEQKKAFAAALKDSRFSVDEAGINELRLIANCIKHDVGRELFQLRPNLFEPSLMPNGNEKLGWHDALKLTDADIERALAAARSSGPKAKSPAAPVEDVTF
jgi:hypothetical protein